MIRSIILFFILIAAAAAQNSSGFALGFEPQATGREDADYQAGRSALDAGQWDKAIEAFSASAARKGAAADAALYFKAYAQNKAGLRQDALGTINTLQHSYPKSRWLDDAKTLEVEIHTKTGGGVDPASQEDDDMRLIAINSLLNSDPKLALPILERLLTSNNSEKIKERALFVLTQSGQPEAVKVMSNLAHGSSGPELQMKAIRYMGMTGSETARQDLVSVYKSTSSKEVKHAILHSFMQSGSRDFLLNVAKTESDPELRRDAIRQIMMTGGQDELWQMYQSTSSEEDKQEILRNMFMGGNSTKLADVARAEKDPKLRVTAIRSLGLMGDKGHGDVLVGIYRSDSDREVRDAVLNALFIQQNGKALIDLARSEKDPGLKKEIVSKMALIHSKETTDYMMEILK